MTPKPSGTKIHIRETDRRNIWKSSFAHAKKAPHQQSSLPPNSYSLCLPMLAPWAWLSILWTVPLHLTHSHVAAHNEHPTRGCQGGAWVILPGQIIP